MAALAFLLVYGSSFLTGWLLGELMLRKKDAGNTLTYQERKPLILLNIILLVVLVAVGFTVFSSAFSFSLSMPIWIIATQFLLLLLVDDAWFYWFHRLMHVNKYLLRKVHVVHHRVRNPLPLDYFYVHPIDWLLAGAGIPMVLFATYMIFGTISFYAVLIWAIYKAFHELDLHSGIRSYISNQKGFGWFANAEYHGAHHKQFQGNFASTLTIWDKLLGTKL